MLFPPQLKRHLLLFCLIAFATTSCDTDGGDTVNCDFDAAAMRTNYADGIIIPQLEEWHLSTQVLVSMANYFASQPNAENLVELRITFFASYKVFQEVSSFAYGPGVINGQAFRDMVNTFPTNANIINSQVVAGNVNAAVNPVSTVGYPALEYLLFGAQGATQAEVVSTFNDGPDAADRVAYVVSLVQHLNSIAQGQVDGWETYRATFINASGSGEGSTLEQLVNQFNRDLENLKNYKLQIPLGKFNGGVVIPDQLEGYYSGGSAQLANAQLQALRNIYLGVGANGSDGLGLHDYLECLRAGEDADGLLSEAISDQFQAIADAFMLLEDPLSQQLVNNKPVVNDAYVQLQMMVPLVKREMSSAMGVQISYVSGDGD
jgi:predicted lipoprotein